MSLTAAGLAFSIQGIEHLSLGAVQTGIILLSGLFAYGEPACCCKCCQGLLHMGWMGA